MIRVFVIARSEVVRAGLVSVLEQNSDPTLIVTGTASHSDSPIRGEADVILIDSDEPFANAPGDRDGIDPTPIVLLTDEPALTAIQDGSRFGLRAALPRSAAAPEIVAAIVAAANGLIAMRATAWLGALRGRRPTAIPDNSPREELTAREAEVLGMLAEGHSNKTIAWRLSISESTVKFHISAIFSKLNASSRTEAVAIGVRLGLIML